ncbi:MAG: c-type cytochrome [Nitrospirae bacterium]|nr:c-type cytochrome [Nitrospirota bacterium]
MKLTRNQLILNAVFCLTLLIVIIWALYAEYNRPWKKYRKEAVQDESLKIRQVWLRDSGEADRCITCHGVIDNPDFNNNPQPHRTHSGNYLKHHKVERFGCVLCHDGQGVALTVKAAHGYVENWTKPLLKGSFAQSSCGKCHPLNQALPLNVELNGASKFIEGWRLFNEYNCIGCHKLRGNEIPGRIAPSLTLAGNKVNRDWLVRWLRNPKAYLPNAKMPRFNLSDEEIGYMADYLMGGAGSSNNFKNPPASPFFKGGNSPLLRGVRGVSPSLEKGGEGGFLDEGQTLVASLGCLGCHSINGAGNSFAPDLTNIGSKVNADWLVRFLKNPKAYDPKTAMPDMKTSGEDIQSIAAYLMSLKKEKKEKNPPFPPLAKGGNTPLNTLLIEGKSPPLKKGDVGGFNIDKGKKLVRDKGCTGCHETEDLPAGYDAPPLDGLGSKRVDEIAFGNITDVEKTLSTWLMLKVRDPQRFATEKIIARMPDYGFSEEKSEALVTFLLSVRNEPVPPQYVKTLIDPDKAGARGKSVLEKHNCLGCHKLGDPGGNIAPDLSGEMKKSRPEWLFAFLKSPFKIRPEQILKAKMPDFNLSDKDVNVVVEYLAFVSGEPYPYNFEVKKEITPEDAQDGEKLYKEIFACAACHRVDGKGGEVGPEHTDTASRLNRKWIEQWLKDPQAIQPEVRMPRFKFKDWEYEALMNYLMTLGKYRFVKVKQAD